MELLRWACCIPNSMREELPTLQPRAVRDIYASQWQSKYHFQLISNPLALLILIHFVGIIVGLHHVILLELARRSALASELRMFNPQPLPPPPSPPRPSPSPSPTLQPSQWHSRGKLPELRTLVPAPPSSCHPQLALDHQMIWTDEISVTAITATSR